MPLNPNDPNNIATIDIRAYPIDGQPWYHMFIIYTLSNAQGDSVSYCLRGGPSSDATEMSQLTAGVAGGGSGIILGNPVASSGNSPWGIVQGWQGEFVYATPDFDKPGTVSLTIKQSTQAELEPVFIRMTEALEEIVAAEHRYNPINSNSNTVAFSLLDIVDREFPGLGLAPRFPLDVEGEEVWAPGAETNFNTPLGELTDWTTGKIYPFVTAVVAELNTAGDTYHAFMEELSNDLSQALTHTPKPQIWRDPNVVTFDRLKYDFQAPGPYIAVKGHGVNDSFEIQTFHRMISMGVSVITAAASRIGETPVEFYLPPRGVDCSTERNDVIRGSDVSPTVIYGGPDTGMHRYLWKARRRCWRAMQIDRRVLGIMLVMERRLLRGRMIT